MAHRWSEWSGGDSDKPTTFAAKMNKKHEAPRSPEQALWKVVSRIAPSFRWLKTDLFMLGALPHNAVIVNKFAELLSLLGQQLLPNVGVVPLENMDAARPEVMELASLLAFLPSPSQQQEPSVSDTVEDPLVLNDPWSQGHGYANCSGKDNNSAKQQVIVHKQMATASQVQYVTVEKIVEKLVEVPLAKPLTCVASTCTENATQILRVDASSQSEQIAEDEARLLSLVGVWEPANTVYANDVIKVRDAFLSADSAPVRLSKGFRGIVKSIDKDGDIEVYIPSLRSFNVYKNVFVYMQDFPKLSRLKT